ncbi:hypothetical protein EYC80_003346 [Monilinia laxa]|uniref:Uncharacterized protein n=1 Tax=Monilinia laxa TaxID=61186 RepID=A0A5N6KDJ5_MONLA|nr:hypothetical protein EYC80_003346 [Monilinia laxa]
MYVPLYSTFNIQHSTRQTTYQSSPLPMYHPVQHIRTSLLLDHHVSQSDIISNTDVRTVSSITPCTNPSIHSSIHPNHFVLHPISS